jgi:hypothetical protein
MKYPDRDREEGERESAEAAERRAARWRAKAPKGGRTVAGAAGEMELTRRRRKAGGATRTFKQLLFIQVLYIPHYFL